jgi:hypothetical protein
VERTIVVNSELEDFWYPLLLEAKCSHSATERIRSIEKSNDLIGNRTRELPCVPPFSVRFEMNLYIVYYLEESLYEELSPVTICTICFDILKLCILPTECICVFRVVLTINSDCFPKQH